MKNVKTNAMRLLDKEKIEYMEHDFLPLGEGEEIGYDDIAQRTGVAKERIFKTIVTVGHSGNYFVFVLPGTAELNLKKAARAVGEKSIELLPIRDLEKVTGYVRGGCSPVGVKKLFKTTFDETILTFDRVMVSAGKRGFQIELSPMDLLRATGGALADIKSDTKGIF